MLCRGAEGRRRREAKGWSLVLRGHRLRRRKTNGRFLVWRSWICSLEACQLPNKSVSCHIQTDSQFVFLCVCFSERWFMWWQEGKKKKKRNGEESEKAESDEVQVLTCCFLLLIHTERKANTLMVNIVCFYSQHIPWIHSCLSIQSGDACQPHRGCPWTR